MRGEVGHVLFQGLAKIDDPGAAKAVEQIGYVHRFFLPPKSSET
jgi:hypothetical protein